MVKALIEGEVAVRKTVTYDKEVFDAINTDRGQIGFSPFVNAHFRKYYKLDGPQKNKKSEKEPKKSTTKKL